MRPTADLLARPVAPRPVRWQHRRLMLEAYRVVEVRAIDGAKAPPEIANRFQGRLWTKRQLEERGVRITGADAWYLASGRDWKLTLAPAG